MKIKSEEEMIELGKTIAEQINLSKYDSLVIYLKGNLGAGKTTFAKGFVKGMDFNELVTSPTYNLIETIETNNFIIYHVDLYRIESLNQILELELHEKPIIDKPYIYLIEWPENGEDYILSADLIINISFNEIIHERLIDVQKLSKKVSKFEDSWIK
ncbi:MAG: tRNA (adenosine(37)-N6)-threonylcarbamoyltransferase complex ATPase subunit type 1 TsaE [Gammaproteobacteria bacterium]|jgi:tRNA threonylcarbamoyladenosine biosynthesis protein TsaE|nr:tRNA (adenosine(37)-N6)-threonylcarbamoyltransferase complex ATPase subunit type 1 TsaE [Gammaproteobacteria bacterium]